MEHLVCPSCGAQNLTTDPQCLACGKSLITRAVAIKPPEPEGNTEPDLSFWETPTGQRRIAILSGGVMLLCLWVLLRGIFGVMLIPLAICVGLWELCAWSRQREQDKRFEHVHDKASLQAELARLDRPDRVVQTKSGPVSVRGFDSHLD
ncbi:hypothetical protein [Armatimonas sp.]|uniref:hypothetical protein n=1 Tax=Armatimonas sp. TaxID=1872638 RepID=UPI00375065D2